MDDFYKKINDKSKYYKFNILEDIHVDKYSLWKKVIFSDIMNFNPNNYVVFTHSISIRTKSSEFYKGLNKGEYAILYLIRII